VNSGDVNVEKCNLRNFRRSLTLTLIQVTMCNTYKTTNMPDHVTIASSTRETWPFEIHVISTFHKVWTHVSFLKRKSENRALTSCRLGAVLSWSTISFELHAKMAEEIDLEKCNFWQFSEVQKPHDLDLGSGQGHISMHDTCRTTSMPNHLSVASRTAEIWPFEFREISTFRELWTLVIGFLEGNLKIGLQQAVDQVPYYY